MRLDLETEIRYPSGERVGILRKVVLDEDNQATDIVMSTNDAISLNLLVPVSMLSEGPGGVLCINATSDEVYELEAYEEQRVPAAPLGWEFSEDAAPGGDVFPATVYQPIIPVAEWQNLPEGSVSLSQGTEVWCLDGRWGIVDEVLIDDTGKAYAFVARPDDTEEHDRTVPIELVQEVGEINVTLSCTLIDLPNYSEEIIDAQKEPEPDERSVL